MSENNERAHDASANVAGVQMVNAPARVAGVQMVNAPAQVAGACASGTPAQITYAQAGVNIEEGARAVDAIKSAVHSTYRPEVLGDIGGFGGLFDISAIKDMEQPILVSGTDGVGTKLKVAQFLGKHDTIGIDLVAMCVNDVLACGAEPLFFLDYVAVGKLDAGAMREIVGGIAKGCKQAGCALVGGEMAEHPGVMDASDYDVSGFCVALVDRPKMLGAKNVCEGDVLIGLASSGLHSNGYSLARKVTLDAMSHEEAMAPRAELGSRLHVKANTQRADLKNCAAQSEQMFDCTADPCADLASASINEPASEATSIAKALLTPTRIYVRPVLDAIADVPGAIHALAHITGGGITENLNRALPDNMNAQVQLGTWDVPPIISHVVNVAHLTQSEALKTFNMGVGIVLIVDAECACDVEQHLKASGETTYRIGRVVQGAGVVEYV